MTEIANNQVAAQVQQGLNDQAQKFAASAQQDDNPLHRMFSLTALVLTPDELKFTLCPTT